MSRKFCRPVVQVFCSEKLYGKVENLAKARDTSLSDIGRRALTAYLSSNAAYPPPQQPEMKEA
jgi:hypothetical protein